jgi:KAP family P-loop domain
VAVLNATQIRFRGDDVPPNARLSCTPDLAAVIADAVQLSAAMWEDINVAYSPLIMAICRASDEWSVWLREHFTADDPVGTLIEQHGQAVELGPLPANPSLLNKVLFISDTVSALFGPSFENLLRYAGPDTPVDVRHLVACYLCEPVQHYRMDRLGLTYARRQAAFAEYRAIVAERWPDELARYPATIPEPPNLAPSVAQYIEGDIWTLTDQLGYARYVTALHHFITHGRTVAPLCISVQAPWGGGKTSLMRMLQKTLGPQAVSFDNADAERPIPRRAGPQQRDHGEGTSVGKIVDRAKAPIGKLTLGEVLSALRIWKRNGKLAEPTCVKPASTTQCLTVWFNAWKYDGTNEVWAGLADAIIKQISRRMTPLDREKFFLQLNLSRIDADKVRTAIYNRIYSETVQKLAPWVLGWCGVALTGLLALVARLAFPQLAYLGEIGAAASLLGSGAALAHGVIGHFLIARNATGEKAATTVGEYLTMPPYDKEFGFVHSVDADLRRVLGSVPTTYWPIVIFIDDLDRCSPNKVAQVMEAVNLFLAGEFARCIFVMGMDSEMVAASLDVAHKDVIGSLPKDAKIPVGWRFMDKFVQLPFVIPPVGDDSAKALAVSALIRPDARTGAVASGGTNGAATAAGAPANGATTAEGPAPRPDENAGQEQTIADYDEGSAEFAGAVKDGVSYFAGNPREIKRFLNVFRLYVYLWGDRARSQASDLTLAQIVGWCVFLMKWPDVLRWVRRAPRFPAGHGAHGRDMDPPVGSGQAKRQHVIDRLQLLEDIGLKSKDAAAWGQALQTRGNVPPETRWLFDDELRAFLHDRSAASDDRLSAGVGEGLW